MRCPKCQQGVLIEQKHNRWHCTFIYPNEYKTNKDGTVKEIKGQPCGFACGLAFFFDDNDIDVKTEVGINVENLTMSPRAQSLIESGALGLDEIERVTKVSKLPEIIKAEKADEDWNELNAIMRDVVGRSAGVHRTLSNGESYRKNSNGGLVSHRLG